MRKEKQETREEKISRHIRNQTRALEQYPSLSSVRKRKMELEARLLTMPLAERQALVPWEETKREAKQSIALYTELIGDLENELKTKQREIKGQVAELSKCRATLIRRLARL